MQDVGGKLEVRRTPPLVCVLYSVLTCHISCTVSCNLRTFSYAPYSISVRAAAIAEVVPIRYVSTSTKFHYFKLELEYCQ